MFGTLSLACTKKSSPVQPSKDADPQTITYKMGNPWNLIEGATLNPNVDFSFFEGTSQVLWKMTREFEEFQTLPNEVKEVDLQKENAAPHEAAEEDSSRSIYNVHVLKDDEGYPIAVLKNESRTFLLTNRPEGERHILRVQYPDSSYSKPILLHASVSKDKQNMSLLIWQYPNGGTRTLSALYFSKKLTADEPVRIGQYYYLQGLGIKMAWPKDQALDISLCGYRASPLKDYAREAVDSWNEVLEKKLVLNLKEDKSYPPFSDLNHRGIYWVDDFFIDPRPKISGYAFAAFFNDGSANFVDSDVMVFKSELNKTKEATPYVIQRTLTHELGHFLGLHHMFDGTKSIMSYDFSDDGVISDYDKTAIQELYK